MRQHGKTNSNVVNLNLTIAIITSNINSLNIPVKRQRLSAWIKEQGQPYAVYKKPTLNNMARLKEEDEKTELCKH